MKKTGQTLEEFLTSMTAKIEAQADSNMRVGTVLVDLSQELELVLKDLIEHAQESRGDLDDAKKQIERHQKLGTAPETDEPVIQKAWTAVGEVNAYLYAVTKIRDLCVDVMGRNDETKH